MITQRLTQSLRSMAAGPAVISAEVYRELSETGEFDTLSAEADEVRQPSCLSTDD